MAIITLTTDWNSGDHYLSALKGKLMSLLPGVTIVDITHQLPAFAYIRAAFILRNSYKSYPKGTVHLIGVNSEASKDTPHVAILHEDQYFIGADNGMFGVMFNGKPDKAFLLEHSTETTFPEFDVFADAAVYLANGGNIENLGGIREELYVPTALRATIDDLVINGSIIYIDSFSNAITNITREVFEKNRKGRRFEILVQSNHYRIISINKHYNESADGDLLAIFNSAGLLEIAINKGNAAELLNLGVNATIRVKFFDTPERQELKLL